MRVNGSALRDALSVGFSSDLSFDMSFIGFARKNASDSVNVSTSSVTEVFIENANGTARDRVNVSASKGAL